jgi:hypothetical protein
MNKLEAVKESMKETRAQVEKIGYYEGALKCSWAEIALAQGAEPITTFWALRRMLGSDESKYQQEAN